jgi:hypothetical protein
MENNVRWNVKLIFADGALAKEGTTIRDPCSSIWVPASYEHFYLWEVLRNPITSVSLLIQADHPFAYYVIMFLTHYKNWKYVRTSTQTEDKVGGLVVLTALTTKSTLLISDAM